MAASLPRGIYEKVPGSKCYWIRYTTVDGIRHREKAGNLSMAKSLLALREADKLKGKLPEKKTNKSVTFSDLIDDAISHAKAQGQDNPAGARDLELKLNRIRPAFGKRPAASIQKNEIVDWLAEESEKRDWKPASRNRYQSAFSLVFRVGMDNQRIDRNPASLIEKLQELNQRTRFLNPDEEEALTAAIEERFPEYVPIFILAIHTGMRASEQLRSLVGDYNPRTNLLTVRQRKAKRAGPFRHVPLTPMAVEAYQTLAKGKSVGETLCTNTLGGDLQDTRYWFDPCVIAAGLIDLLWHDLRHTAASRWVMSGVPLPVVSGYLGHQSIQMTMRYSHLQPANHDRSIAAMMSFYPATKVAGHGEGNGKSTKTSTGTFAKISKSRK